MFMHYIGLEGFVAVLENPDLNFSWRVFAPLGEGEDRISIICN